MGNVEFGFVGDEIPRPSADSRDFITNVARLLGVDLAVLVKTITTKKQIISKEVLESSLTIEQVYQARDSLCKHLYGSIFSWIVQKINASISIKNENDSSKPAKKGKQ